MLNIREMRSNLGRLEELLEQEGEIVIMKNKRAIAKIVPIAPKPKKLMPSLDEHRASLPYQDIPSEVLIREDRDAR